MMNPVEKPHLRPRVLNPSVLAQAKQQGLPDIVARVLAGRIRTEKIILESVTDPSLKFIPPPQLLKDADRAAERIARAVMQGEKIGILTDYDVDGITSHAVIYRTLTELFGHSETAVFSLIGHRIYDGYGVSAGLISRILQQPELPDLIITADCGSSDEARLALLQQAGIDVIVTDHHALPAEGAPQSAYAVVNPTQQDCRYPDATIAGCMVSWLVMAQVREALIQRGYLAENASKLSFLLGYVALGTVADCVSLGESAVNRAVVQAGLQLINRFDQPCWRAIRKLLRKEQELFAADTLAFQLGPRINARGRLDDPYAALNYILARDDPSAERYLNILDQDNEARKAIEAEMLVTALEQATDQLAGDVQAITVFLPAGHPGVQGIVASRITQKTGRPSVVLCPALNPDHLTGSARSIEQIHIRDVLQHLSDHEPELLERFGGHRGAAGLTLNRSRLDRFTEAFNASVMHRLAGERLYPVILTDGELDPGLLNLDTWQQLQRLQPFGREFEPPCFSGDFQVDVYRPVGADQSHLSLELSVPVTGQRFRAIWFRALADGQHPDFGIGDCITAAFQLQRNEFRGDVSLQLLIEHAVRTDTAI